MSGRIRGRGGAIAVLVLLIVGLAVGSMATATTIYVDENAAGENNGTSWEDAYTNLQTALGAPPASGDQIWVAQGVYYTGTTQTSSFTLKDGVALYGGYPTSGGTRDVANNVTVLSGDIGKDDTTNANGVTTTISGNNAYHVVKSSNNDSSAVLDGFTVTGGNANGGGTDDGGGGMFNYDSSPTVTGCTFSGNTANRYGGGMYNYYYYSPMVTNCTFSGNTASFGGGMYNSLSSSPTVTNCTFSGNTAHYGGGMYNDSSSPTVTGCTFSGNTADYGGGMFNDYESSPTVTGCTFSGNTASLGGGMYNHSSSPTVRNTILWGDTASSGAEIYNSDTSSTPTVEHSVVEGGYTGGTNIITADPLLGTLGDYGGSTETIPLLVGSSAIDSARTRPTRRRPTSAVYRGRRGRRLTLAHMSTNNCPPSGT